MFITEWTDIECLSYEPTHYIQVGTENLPNMEGVSKTTNSLPKFYVEVENFNVPGTELIFKCFLNSTCE